MNRTDQQSSSLKCLFHTVGGDLETAFQSQDIVSGSIVKQIHQPAGGFTVSLVPRQKYLDLIRPGDWVELYLDDGRGPPSSKPYMIGNVDGVTRTRQVGGKGEVTEMLVVTGRDFGKVLACLQIVYDTTLADPTTVKALITLVGSFIATKKKGRVPMKSPDTLVRTFLDTMFKNRGQFLPPGAVLTRTSGYSYDVQSALFDLDYSKYVSPTKGFVMFNTEPNLQGTLWGTIEQYSHGILNEMFIDTLDGVPSLVMRQYPFSKSDFSSLNIISINADEVSSEHLSTSDRDVKNWFRVAFEPAAGQNASMLTAVAGAGWLCPDSIQRHGVRRFEVTTNAWGSTPEVVKVNSETGNVGGLMHEYAGLLAEWHYQNDVFLSGSLSTGLRADAHIGCRLNYDNDYTDEHLSFYVEAVNHDFKWMGGASSTTFTVTRGTLGDLSRLKTLSELSSEGGDGTLVPIKTYRETNARATGLIRGYENARLPLLSSFEKAKNKP